MITNIEPEPGGEAQGILRVEFSLPLSIDELRSLRDWFDANGWPIEVDQIDEHLQGEPA